MLVLDVDKMMCFVVVLNGAPSMITLSKGAFKLYGLRRQHVLAKVKG